MISSPPEQSSAIEQPTLKRALSLPLVVLYGLGVTIGAGIYVLIGVTAGRAGIFAPMSFVIAAFVMSFSAASFAELSGRYPVSAGEAAFVRAGFKSKTFALLIGLLVVVVGCISAAAISVGAIGYIQVFVAAPDAVLIVLVVLSMGAIAAVGILGSVLFAASMTLLEIGGLLAIVIGGFANDPELLLKLPSLVPGNFEPALWTGILGASLLAFFAFIGFEDLVNIAEEVERPETTMPWAIFLTLMITTLLYVMVVSIAVLAVPTSELAVTKAPLSLVFARVTNLSPSAITFVAIVATLNGIIVQMIMASRVIYGLAAQGNLPKQLATISPNTRTPLVATALIGAVIMVLALIVPIEGLAETTSTITLIIFTVVNVALVKIKLAGDTAPSGVYIVPFWVPVIGAIVSLFFLTSNLIW
jgi:APA family basic amino acid/polyamine antiporter